MNNPQSSPTSCSSKATSIKTRIETYLAGLGLHRYERLPKQLPLKQGLKQVKGKLRLYNVNSSKATSIKTRIETHGALKCLILNPKLPKQLPLKQGLKQATADSIDDVIRPSKATSIKTRIETYNNRCRNHFNKYFQSNFH